MTLVKTKLNTINKFNLVKAAALKMFPFIASFLSKNLRVVVTPAIETAGVSKHTIYINPDFWDSLSELDALFTIIHEALHIALFDLVRFESLPKELKVRKSWNVAADVVNNEIVYETLKYMMDNVMTYQLLSTIVGDRVPDDVKGHKERLHKWILSMNDDKCCNSSSMGTGEALSDDMIDDQTAKDLEQNGKEIFRGTKWEEFKEASKNKQDYQEKIQSEISKAYMAAKMAGNMPEGLERMIRQLLKSKVDWKILLRQKVRSYLSRFIINTWRRPSRRLPYVLPGYNKYSIPDIWAIVDTSGSIGDKELEQFMTEIFEASRVTESKIHVVFFDADAYGPYTVKKPEDVLRLKPQGGGGTVIEPAIELVSKMMKQDDVLLILTDGYIYSKESEADLNKIKDRLWIVTTGTTPYKSLKDRTIYIEDL